MSKDFIDRAIESTNLIDQIDMNEAVHMGAKVIEGYDADELSREEWLRKNQEWMKLAIQITEKKTFPWEDASNVKYPLLSTAALQFNARAYPALVGSTDLVRVRPLLSDPTGQVSEIADALATHMSYQLLTEMEDWEEDMDKLCFILPIVGTAFKKTYYDEIEQTNCSELVQAENLVVDYWARSLESAYRISQVFWLSTNEIKERQNLGIYTDVDLGRPSAELLEKYTMTHEPPAGKAMQKQPPADESVPRKIVEQHTTWDLDGDGYAEPYVITVDYQTKHVLRIVARYRKDGIKLKGKKILKITPIQYFTKFSFIPNPDGGFYDVGFGLLLGSLNESANTVINQLIDAGTLSNMQPGFLSKGIRIRGGDYTFRPGEWKFVNNFGDDLKKGVFPLPVREPSNVLFQLLGTLIQSGKELTSVQDIMTGKMPGQNTPATTTQTAVEQGQKVFTSIHKRVYRALGKEFEKLYHLNSIYLPEDGVAFIHETEMGPQDLKVTKKMYQQMSSKVLPAADPNMVSDAQKIQKAQLLAGLLQTGQVNPKVTVQRILAANNEPRIAEIMNMPPPPPNPEMIKIQGDLTLRAQELQLKAQEVMSASQERHAKAFLAYVQARALASQDQGTVLDQQYQQFEMNETAMQNRIQIMMDAQKQQHDQMLAQQQQAHDQALARQKQAHSQALATQESNAKVQAMQQQAAQQPSGE